MLAEVRWHKEDGLVSTQTEIQDSKLEAAAVRFTIVAESADDPESNRTWTGISAEGIRAEWPLFAALFPDDCDNSLTFTAELNRWQITPEYEP